MAVYHTTQLPRPKTGVYVISWPSARSIGWPHVFASDDSSASHSAAESQTPQGRVRFSRTHPAFVCSAVVVHLVWKNAQSSLGSCDSATIDTDELIIVLQFLQY